MKRYLSFFVILLLILFLQLGHYFNILDIRFFPTVPQIWDSYVSMWQNGELVMGFIYSFSRISIATLIAVSISAFLGILIVLYKPFRFFIEPLTSSFRFIPVTALYPLLILWAGIDELMKVSFISIALLFYFLPTILNALDEMEHNLIDTALTLGASKYKLIVKVIIPYMLPSMLSSLGIMYGIGWTYVIIAEIVNAKHGLGHLMNLASSRGRLDVVFGILFLIAVFSYWFDAFWNLLITKLFPWKFQAIRSSK